MMCNGEACNLCGAGCWDYNRKLRGEPRCETMWRTLMPTRCLVGEALRANGEETGEMATAVEKQVIDAARLVLLGWVGDGVDGGAAMREALPRLRAAFEILESRCRCGHGLLMHEDNDHTVGLVWMWTAAATNTRATINLHANWNERIEPWI